MRVLFDIVHPADVHFFKHSISRLRANGHEVMLASRAKDIVLELLAELDLPNRVVSAQGEGIIGLGAELVRRDAGIFQLARDFRPDVLVGNNSASVAHVGFVLKRPSLVFDDTEINRYVRALYLGLVTEVHTPSCYRLDLGGKQRRYPSHHALAYLHPAHFEADPGIVGSYGLAIDEPYFLFRFVRFGASHDLGNRGLTPQEKLALVRLASRYGRAVVSSEDPVPAALADYALPIRVSQMHHILAGCAALVGESATMCSEAACLGRPSLLIDRFGRGYTDELEEKYRLVRRVEPSRRRSLLAAAERFFQDRAGGNASAQRQRLLSDMVDVSRYQLAQIERLAQVGAGNRSEVPGTSS